MRVSLCHVGIVGPGLTDWASVQAVLRGDQPYVAATLNTRPPVGLPPNESRRATLATRLALDAARQATTDIDCSRLSSVFASSDGDMGLIDNLCRDLFQHRFPPSPTVFQNSVHNAVAGYWSIAEGCRQPSTSLAAGDGSFAAGLLEAATQSVCFGNPVLLVACDVPAPELLHPHRPFGCAFACALLLEPSASGMERVTLDLTPCETDDGHPLTTMRDPDWEALRLSNPAARALPLLAAVAAGQDAGIRLPYWSDLRLDVRLSQTT
ncbi:beta-ketoacyl synthase chain length factor [Thiocystis violascens]|uniref:Beta-ketoacyl synthase-like N-terminal domain-containing protein n=1 Tax=Thiocystis violascens (strain ATCC 17096 / DSM 198 / 6111) TaxID=765911 RepID=I3YB36_THIV6|nr:beta-ketoacyl synthase chain length factor [Thiocystis violascens]AFL74204.1 hypothetical protein Thivi_2255 [Thiocystis violascens DSM 198]